MAVRLAKRSALHVYVFLLAISACTDSLFAQAGVTLGTTFVPKEKIWLYVCIGNSAMSGRDPARDLSTVANAWNYRIPNPDRTSNTDIAATLYKWNPASAPLHIDVNSTGKQDPPSQFIKKLAQKYTGTGYYFGVVQLSGSAYLISTFQRGQKRYDTIVNNVLALKNNVTIAAIVSMFNLVEMEKTSAEVAAYLTNTTTTVSQMRSDLGMPNLPYIHSGYPVLAKGVYDTSKALPKQILPLIRQIPSTIANSLIIPTEGLTIYQDVFLSHYDSAGCANWGARVADTVYARKWAPPMSACKREAVASKRNAVPAIERVFVANGKLPVSLTAGSAGLSLYTLNGKCVGGFDRTSVLNRSRLLAGVYVIRRNSR